MDAVFRSIRKLVVLMSPVLAAVLAGPSACSAGGAHGHHWYCWPFVDCSTRCAWHRTWHGPIPKPLNAYYIPRDFTGCGGDCYADRCGCGEVVADSYVGWPNDAECELAAECCPLVEPLGMERLGQIPNDIGLTAGSGAGLNRPSR